MTKNELLDLIRLGEGLTLEFKRSISGEIQRMGSDREGRWKVIK